MVARTLFLSTLGFVAVASASAQTVVVSPENSINTAFASLNSTADFSIALTGNEWIGSTNTPFDITLVWHQTGSGDIRTIKVSMYKRVAGVLQWEIRAQGERLLKYDYRARTYTSTTYHRVVDPKTPALRDAGYISRMLGALVKEVPASGPEAYVARLIQQAMGDPVVSSATAGTSVFYRRWVPTRKPYDLRNRTDLLLASPPSPPDTYADPLLGAMRSYLDLEDDDFQHVVYEEPSKRTIIFKIENDSVLNAVYFGEYSRVRNQDRYLEWTLNLTAVVVDPSMTNYETQFAPYTDLRGWRPLASPRG